MLHHIGFIMDGNRRFSKKNNLDYSKGYEKGMLKFFEIIQWQVKENIKTTSFFALSLDNSKKRNVKELQIIKDVISKLLENPLFEDFCVNNGVHINIRGRYFKDNSINHTLLELDRRNSSYENTKFADSLIKKKINNELNQLGFQDEDELLNLVEEKIKEFELKLFEKYKNPPFIVNIALFYDGIDEIVTTTQKIAQKVKNDELNIEDISAQTFFDLSYFSNTSPPEIIVRTGDAPRISGFMLTLSAYSELYLTKQLWPELEEEDLNQIILWFNSIQRNFGK